MPEPPHLAPLNALAISKQIIGLCEDSEYVDVWRTLTLQIKNSPSFITPTSVIQELITFLPQNSLWNLFSCSIGNIISDHAAVYMNVTFRKLSKKPTSWKMDTSILKDHKFISYFTTEFKHFLTTNFPSATNSSILWETSKAFARGLIISYTETKRCKNMEHQTLFEKRLSISEKDYVKKPTAAKLREIIAICSSLDSLLTKKAMSSFRICKTKII